MPLIDKQVLGNGLVQIRLSVVDAIEVAQGIGLKRIHIYPQTNF